MWDKKITIIDVPYRLREFLLNYKGMLTEYEASAIFESMLEYSEKLMYLPNELTTEKLAVEIITDLVNTIPLLNDQNTMNMLYYVMDTSSKDLLSVMFLVDIIGHVKHSVRFNENVCVLETYKIYKEVS